MRLIDADAWEKFYTERTRDLEPYDNYDNYDNGYSDAMDHVDDWIDAQLTIEAKPVKHGKWSYDAYSGGYRCSNCKLTSRNCTRYCPNCGAKMDLGG